MVNSKKTISIDNTLFDTLVFSGLCLIIGILSLCLSKVPQTITPLWLANIPGIILLLRHQPSRWLVPLISLSVINFSVYMLFGKSPLYCSYLTIINLIEIIFSTWMLKHFQIVDYFDQQFKSAALLILLVTLIAPTLRMGLGIALFGLDDHMHFWENWFVGDGIGMTSLLPLTLCLLRNMWRELTLKTSLQILLWLIFTTSLALPTLIYVPYAFIIILMPLLAAAVFNCFFVNILIISFNIFLIFSLYNAGIYIPLIQNQFQASYFIYLPTILLFTASHLLSVFLTILRKTKEQLIDSEQALYNEKEHLKTLLDSVVDAIIATDSNGLITFINPAAAKITGWTLEEAKGLSSEVVFKLINKKNEIIRSPMNYHLANNKPAVINKNAVLINKSGAEFDIQYSIILLENQDKKVIGAELIFQNITQNKTFQKELNYKATHDSLTDLLNRREFEKALHHAQEQVNLTDTTYVLCYLDLDNFKIVNDSLGHAAGDTLLQEIAGLLQQRIRKEDVLARLGGDEFGILLSNCDLSTGKIICQQIIDLINAFRFPWKNKIYRIGVSIGLVLMFDKMLSTNQLLSAADVACYSAKAAGRNQFIIYKIEPNKTIEYHQEIRLASTLQEAIDKNHFVLYAQKIIPINPKEPKNPRFEILIRLLDENNEIITANAFIPTAEHFNLMPEIDRWILKQIFQKYDKKLAALPNSYYSINLSGNSLNDPSFLEFLTSLIQKSAIPPERLCFEITETATMSQLSKTVILIKELQKLGCKIALDDFGVGLSSFSYIKNFSVDYIKIDGSFVKNIIAQPVDRTIVETIHLMAHQLGMKTIAEYVENQEILNLIAEIGIDYAQGFSIGKPEPLDDIIDKL